MKYLEKEYKIENYDIKADSVVKQNYTNVLSLRKHLDVRIGNKVLNVPTKSLLKIFSYKLICVSMISQSGRFVNKINQMLKYNEKGEELCLRRQSQL